MHPILKESILQKVILKLKRLASYKLLNWYKLGEIQQAWYLKKLFKMYDIDLVVDVGGNIGQYASFIRNKVSYKGKIITVEPMPFAATELKQKFKGDKNWSLEQCAISNEETTAEFNILKGHQMSSLSTPTSDSSDAMVGLQEIVEKITVKVKTLDAIFGEHPFAKESKNIYLKLDIQGHELAAMEGCKHSLNKIVALQAEFNVISIYENSIKYYVLMKEMEDRGYILSFVPAHNYRFFPDMVDFDCHYIKKEKMIEKGYLKSNKKAH